MPVRTITFKTDDSLAAVMAYYRDALVPLGWKAHGTNSFVDRTSCPIYTLYIAKEADIVTLDLLPEGCYDG